MEKIVIIGSSGAGKSTLARKLGPLLQINVFHLDRLFWKRGWKKIDRDTRIDTLQKIVMGKRWIIEGSYPLSSESVMKAADTIIFLDMPLYLCLWRVIERHRKEHGRRRDLPEECVDKLDSKHLWNVLTFPYRGKRKFQHMLDKSEPGQKIIPLCSPKAVDEFLASLVQVTDGKNSFSGITFSIAKENSLVANIR